nr:tandem-95 repeat protein [Planctomycetota bacterium]
MKRFALTLLFAMLSSIATNAQTLQIDPIYIGGQASFEVIGGTSNGMAVVCYSANGSGPFTLSNGLTLDLSMPINQLSPMVLDSFGNGMLGPFAVPGSASVGSQFWFQAVDVNIWGNPILRTTNMVPVTVQNQPNNPPVAMDDSLTLDEDTSGPSYVLLNDSDADGDALSIASFTAPADGVVAQIGDLLMYTPDADFWGTDTFDYVVQDIHGAQDSASVYLTVLPVNDAPYIGDSSVTTDEDMPVSFSVNGSDVEGDVLTYSVGSASRGTVTIVGNLVTYSPDADAYGVDSFTVTASDGSLTGDGVVTVTVNSVNDAPHLGDSNITTDEDVPVSFSVNGSDVEGDVLTYSVGSASRGTVTIVGNLVTYSPDADAYGVDSFTVTASDGSLTGDGVVTVTVNSVNDAPHLGDSNITTDEDVPVSFSVNG